MKRTGLVLFGVLFLVPHSFAQQEGEGDRSEVREEVLRLALVGSVDPADREEACKGLTGKWKERKKILGEIAKGGTDEAGAAWMILGVLGDTSSRGPLQKLLETGSDGDKASAAEILSRLSGSGGAAKLAELLGSDDPAVACAAARGLAKVAPKQALAEGGRKGNSPTRALASLYARQCVRLDEVVSELLPYLTSTNAQEFHFALAVALNLPTVLEKIGRDINAEGKRAARLQERLQKGEMEPAVRRLLALVLYRANVLVLGEVFGALSSPLPGLTEFAEREALRPRVVYPSVLLESLCQQMTAITAENDTTRRLEGLFEKNTGFRAPEASWGDRAKSYRAWWEKNRQSRLDPDINVAIDAGVSLLRRRQKPDGTWVFCECGHPHYGVMKHTAGTTALTVYTLLKCGVTPEDPMMRSGFTYLLSLNLDTLPDAQTYTVSLIAMALSEGLEARKPKKGERRTVAEDAAFAAAARKKLEECAAWLIEAQMRIPQGGYEYGPWTYNKNPGKTEPWDNSNTQFALLGLLACRNSGSRIPAETWQRALAHWKSIQLNDGGWWYVKEEDRKTPGSNGISAAGIGSYLITKGSLKNVSSQEAGKDDPVIGAAIGKFEKTYPVPTPSITRHSCHVFSIYYDLYALERAMMLGGWTAIAGKDWYHDGSLFILYNQYCDGSWIDVTDTCFALLFLKKAYIPVATTRGG